MGLQTALQGFFDLGGLVAAGQRLAFMVVDPTDPGGLFDKSDMTNVGRNYLAMAASMANTLSNDLQNTMNNVMGIGVIMRLVFWIMGITLTFHILTAIFKGSQEGHPKGLLTEVVEALWTNGPRVFIFVLLSLVVAGVSAITNVGTNVQRVHVNNNYVLMKAVNDGEDSPVLAMQQALRNSWGKEYDTVPKPLLPLKAGVSKAINAVSALDLITVSRKVSSELEAAAAKGQTSAGLVGPDGKPLTADQGANADSPIVSLLIKKAVVPLGVAGEEIAFIAAQYSMMKNLVASYIYLVLAWRMTLHFLPLMVCLAYFRSMQGFLMSAMKHLVALSIAGSVMGSLSATLYDGKFWLGNPSSPGAVGKGGLIGDAFKDIVIPAAKPTIYSAGTYPWLMSEVYKYLAVIQVCALFGLVGVLLGEIYNLVRGALDGAMRSSYSANIASLTGR